MADKILSLESVKKCLEKIKELLLTKVSVVEQSKENNSVKLQLGDAGEQLYFHGSTSPNIPVLKKKIINDTTNDSGGLSLGFKINDAIVLAVYMNSCENVTTAYPEVYNNYGRDNPDVCGVRIINHNTNGVVSNTNVSLIVYYLEIPQDYEFPDTTPASDEPEDDEGLAPQSYTTYEKPSETKQFHGESLYE